MKMRGAIIAAAALAIMMSSCDVISQNVATSGPKRYKSEVSSMALEMKDNIAVKGEILPSTRTKFNNIMKNWEKEMGGTGSYIKLKEIQTVLEKIDKAPASAFREQQQINLNLEELLEILKTEIK